MSFRLSTGCALGLTVALTLGAATSSRAQTDTTRQDSTRMRQDSTRMQQDTTRRTTSTRRIPLRKDFSQARSDTTRMQSGGEVMLTQRYDSMFSTERSRVDSMLANDRTRIDELNTKVTDLDTKVSGATEAVAGVRRDVDAMRASQLALSDSLNRLRMAFNRSRNRSLFGNSGFSIGLAGGANFTNGTLHTIGYDQGLNVAIPVAYNRPGTMLGLKAEFAVQTFDGLNVGARTFDTGNGTITLNAVNPDPRIYSATGMVTLNFPFNARATNKFYVEGGGGAYMFRKFGNNSALSDVLGESPATTSSSSKTVTKFGVTGGAGLEFGLVGPASIFVESRFTNVFADKSVLTSGDRANLRFVPVMLGISLH